MPLSRPPISVAELLSWRIRRPTDPLPNCRAAWHAGLVRHWRVAGGLLVDERGLLLVANRRRGGSTDWSTPGGVIDEGETTLGALGREVTEETGFCVARWERLCWTVDVEFVDLEMLLEVEVHLAGGFEGQMLLEDPDGIVTAAEFLDASGVGKRLATSPLWVREPLLAWVDAPWTERRHFSYSAHGRDPATIRAERRLE